MGWAGYDYKALFAAFADKTGIKVNLVEQPDNEAMLAQAKLATLDRLPVRLIGAVVNDVQAEGMYKYYAYLDGYGTLDEDEGPRLVPAGGASLPARAN